MDERVGVCGLEYDLARFENDDVAEADGIIRLRGGCG